MDRSLQEVEQTIFAAKRLWLFLDYDGTLAPFAPSPDVIEPDADLINLISRLVAYPNIRVTLISGRPLSHAQTLLPVPGLGIGGTYGIDLSIPGLEVAQPINLDEIRPYLEQIKPRIKTLLEGRQGFYLEDKDWALAVHARFADPEAAKSILVEAKQVMEEVVNLGPFVIRQGDRFLEIHPISANKRETVSWLLEHYPFPESLPIYIGDDDKDEEAFTEVLQHNGLAILVSRNPRPTPANARLESPAEVRAWLHRLANRFD